MISIVIPTKNSGDVLEQCLSSIEEMDCHAGVAEIVSGHSGDRTAGIAERCGVRHGLHTRDRVARSVSVHVLLWRRVVMGVAGFPAWFVYTLCLLLKWIGSGYTNLPVFDQDVARLTLLVIGLETGFYSFFLSVIGEGN